MLFFSRSPLVLHSFQSACTETWPGLLFPLQAERWRGECWVCVIVLYFKWHHGAFPSCAPISFCFLVKLSRYGDLAVTLVVHSVPLALPGCPFCSLYRVTVLNCGKQMINPLHVIKVFLLCPSPTPLFLLNGDVFSDEWKPACTAVDCWYFSFAGSSTSKWSVCPA